MLYGERHFLFKQNLPPLITNNFAFIKPFSHWLYEKKKKKCMMCVTITWSLVSPFHHWTEWGCYYVKCGRYKIKSECRVVSGEDGEKNDDIRSDKEIMATHNIWELNQLLPLPVTDVTQLYLNTWAVQCSAVPHKLFYCVVTSNTFHRIRVSGSLLFVNSR